MDWGATADTILKAATDKGTEPPPLPFLQNRVTPFPHLMFHWAAFANLSTDRQIGMGLGPVPWTAIDRYAERYGIDDPDEFDRFCRLVRAMDRAFLDWHAERRD